MIVTAIIVLILAALVWMFVSGVNDGCRAVAGAPMDAPGVGYAIPLLMGAVGLVMLLIGAAQRYF